MGLQFKLRIRRATYNRNSTQRSITALTKVAAVVSSDEIIIPYWKIRNIRRLRSKRLRLTVIRQINRRSISYIQPLSFRVSDPFGSASRGSYTKARRYTNRRVR